MVFKDYMIKDDRQFSRFLMEKVNLLDTSQVNSNSILSSLNELYRNDYEKQKYFLQDYYCTYLDSMKPNTAGSGRPRRSRAHKRDRERWRGEDHPSGG